MSDHITLGLGVEVFRSFSGDLVKENIPAAGATTRINFSAKSINLLPNIMIHTGDKGFYSKFGLVYALNPKLEATTTIDNAGLNGKNVMIYRGNSALGLQAGFGLNKTINDKISWFSEVTLVNYVHRPDELVNPENFEGFETAETIEFVKERNVNDSSKELTFPIPYHNVGLNIGIKFTL